MARGNQWGEHFCLTTFGESHGSCVGVVIDGCPSGLELSEADVQVCLDRRRPGSSSYVSPRAELDRVKIHSGVYQGRTTGAPLTMIVENIDAHSQAYEKSSAVLRPGHASYTYFSKWENYDPRGGGRSSARETLARVCAGAVATKILNQVGISIVAFVRQMGPHIAGPIEAPLDYQRVDASSVRCPDPIASDQMQNYLEQLQIEGDSTGGIVEAWIEGLPTGLGSPVFDRFDARLAYAMMSIPATRAFSLDSGFEAATAKGSDFNDSFALKEGRIAPTSNHASGLLGGITTGERIRLQVVFKPASSIRKPQVTCTNRGEEVWLEWKEGFRHDPSVVIRACPVVEAMAALVCVDFLMERPSDKLDSLLAAIKRA